MKSLLRTTLLNMVLALCWVLPGLAQTRPEQPREAADNVKYKTLSEGVHEADLFGTDALQDVRLEVSDITLGPGRSAPDLAVPGFAITQLRSGEVETTIDGQTARRRPGDFWVVRPGQKYALKNLGGLVVLQVITLNRK